MVAGRAAILAIQSQVAYGHVGNSAAVLPLQRLGFDVYPVPTVLLAHHPGYGNWRGHKLTPAQIEVLLIGIEERGGLDDCVAVLSGYLGGPGVGDLVKGVVARIRARRPDLQYLCDPVIGDDGPGIFVAPGIPEMLRDRLLADADVVTPNRFELAWLTGQEVVTLDDTLKAAAALRRLGPGVVVVTGLVLPDRPDELAILADTEAASWLTVTPRRSLPLGGGTGDAFAALFLGHHLRAGHLPLSLERATGAMFALIEATRAAGGQELALVAAQSEFAQSGRRFAARRVR